MHVNNDLYIEQMNHSVVIKLKKKYFNLTFTGISPCFAAKYEILTYLLSTLKNEFRRKTPRNFTAKIGFSR